MPVDIMESKIPRIVLDDGEGIPVLHPNIPQEFAHFPPQTQRKTIRLLEGLLAELHANASMSHLHQLGLIDDQEAVAPYSDQDKASYKYTAIDSCCWQLAQLLRHSTPTRIGEAVPYLTYVVDQKASHAPNHAAVDVIPLFYLGVALARNGDDQRAIDTLETAMNRLHLPDTLSHPLNMMWARTHLAWLYRKAGRASEAESQEQAVCNWIIGHPYAFPPSTLLSNLTDEEITELGAHIVDDPDVHRYLLSLVELDRNIALHTS